MYGLPFVFTPGIWVGIYDVLQWASYYYQLSIVSTVDSVAFTKLITLHAQVLHEEFISTVCSHNSTP